MGVKLGCRTLGGLGVSLIRELKYKDFVMSFDTAKWTVTPEIKKRLDAIREGHAADKFGWMFSV